jgi:hypothetical protein
MKKIEAVIKFVTADVRTAAKEIELLGAPVVKVQSKIASLSSGIKGLARMSGIQTAVQSVGFAGQAISHSFDLIKEAAVGAIESVNHFAEGADVIAKTSHILGLSTDDFQGLRFAAQLSGLSLDEFDTELKKFSVNTGKAINGGMEQKKLFDAIGVKLVDGTGKLRDNKEVLLDVADAFSRLSSAQTKTFAAQELFGRGGTKIIELLDKGKGSLSNTLALYQKLGGGISEADAKAGEKFTDQLLIMNVTLNAMRIHVMGKLMPAFTKLFDTISAFYLKNKDKIDKGISDIGNTLTEGISTLIKHLPAFIKVGMVILSVAKSAVSIIGPWKVLLTGIAVILGGPVLIALLGVVAAFSVIPPVITGIIAGIASIAAPIILAIAAVKIWGHVIGEIRDNWDMLKSFIVDDVLGGLEDKIASFGKSILGLVNSGIEKIKSVFNGIKNFVSELFTGIVKFFLNNIATITDKLSNLPLIGDKFNSVNVAVNHLIQSPVLNPALNPGQNGEAGSAVSEVRNNYVERTTSETKTQRFSIDFKNVPRGAMITKPSSGDYDYSAGYLFGGQ